MIDAQRFLHLRTTAPLSQRNVAERAGVTVPVVRAAEEGRSAQLTLRTAGRLAAALGAKIADIVVDGPDAVDEPAEADGTVDQDLVAADARQLEALLLSAGKLLHHRAAAEALEMTHDRLKAAAGYLEAHNSERGIHFYWSNVKMGLRPSARAESLNVIRRLARQATASDGLKLREAQILFEFHRGLHMLLRRGDRRRDAHPTHERLLSAGLLERDETNRLALSKKVALALEPAVFHIEDQAAKVLGTDTALRTRSGKPPPGNQE